MQTTEKNIPALSNNSDSGNSKHWQHFSRENLTSKNLPWVGSYFNIPEMEPEVQLFKHELTIVMQVLMKNLAVKTYKMEITEERADHAGVNFERAVANLRSHAYSDPDAVGLMVYTFRIDKETGQEKQFFGHFPQIKTSKSTWKIIDHYEGDLGIEKEFSTAFYSRWH